MYFKLHAFILSKLCQYDLIKSHSSSENIKSIGCLRVSTYENTQHGVLEMHIHTLYVAHQVTYDYTNILPPLDIRWYIE